MTINRNDLSKLPIMYNPLTDKLLDVVTKEEIGRQYINKCFKIITADKNNNLFIAANNKIEGECGKGYGNNACKVCVDAINKSIDSFDSGEYFGDYYSVI